MPIPIAIPIEDRSVINYMTTHIGFDHCWRGAWVDRRGGGGGGGMPLNTLKPPTLLVTMRSPYPNCTRRFALVVGHDQCNLDIETVFNVHLLFCGNCSSNCRKGRRRKRGNIRYYTILHYAILYYNRSERSDRCDRLLLPAEMSNARPYFLNAKYFLT